jgi:Protein of unknown function (DUF3237)
MTEALKSEWIMDVKAEVAPPIEIADTPLGTRRIIPIGGGTFEGPRLKGKVVPGGADYQILRQDGVTVLEAKYLLETDDGVTIGVTNRGMRHGSPEVIRKLAAGEKVDPSEYYFRAAPEFETPSGPYDWLNKSLFMSVGERYSAGVVIHIHRIL